MLDDESAFRSALRILIRWIRTLIGLPDMDPWCMVTDPHIQIRKKYLRIHNTDSDICFLFHYFVRYFQHLVSKQRSIWLNFQNSSNTVVKIRLLKKQQSNVYGIYLFEKMQQTMTPPSVWLLIKGVNWPMIVRTLFSLELLWLLLFLLLFFTLSAKPPR